MNSIMTQHKYPSARAGIDCQWLPRVVANLVGALTYG
mgnify:CR=1 FL=1|jgi:hypothetical protein